MFQQLWSIEIKGQFTGKLASVFSIPFPFMVENWIISGLFDEIELNETNNELSLHWAE